ncbi:MAG: insulinase family protein [Clostridiales bacterium]|nr:insulinase family protein [Clostridiales bacterium]
MSVSFQETALPFVEERYTSFVHPSGLRVFLSRKDFHSSYALLTVDFGSLYEKSLVNGSPLSLPDGIAHFLEHKMFDNPDGEDVFLKFSRLGASANAYTGTDRTCYFFSASENIEESLEVMMKSLFSPYFTKANVKKEKGIILQELKMYLDDPGETISRALMRAMYEKSRLREDICGSISSVKSISDRELFEAHNTFYLPSNMILSLCGHFDPDRVLAILDRTLPQTLFTRPEKKPLEDPLPPQCRKRSDRVYADITTPVVAIGIKGTPQNALSEDRLKRFNAMSVLASALFSSWGELVTGLTKDNLIPSDPSYEVVHTGAFSHILFSADTYEPKELIGRFDRLAEKISRQGISEEAFQRGKKVLYADYLSEFNSAEGIASLLASDALEGIDTAKSTESILALRKEEVECLAKDLLTNSRICRVTVWPLGEKSKHPQKGA